MNKPPLAKTRSPEEQYRTQRQTMVDATGKVLEALEHLERESTKMRVLGMAAASYRQGEADAEWFLSAARDRDARVARCARCGRVWRRHAGME